MVSTQELHRAENDYALPDSVCKAALKISSEATCLNCPLSECRLDKAKLQKLD